MVHDPFTLTIIQEQLQAAADESFVRLGRASKSPIIYEVLDYACALLTPQAELIAEAQGVPGFTGVLPVAVESILEKFGADSMRDGDVFATNDPYSGGGTHLSDVCLVGPVIVDGELVAFAANKGHWTELGGMAPGSWTTDATEIYQEGLQLPAVRVYDAGEPVRDIIDLLAANVRLPDMTLSDLYAGVAAIRVAEARIAAICERHGADALRASIDSLLKQGELVARSALAKLPKGSWEAQDFMDDDGFSDEKIPVRVRITVTDEEFIADFSGSSPQRPGPVNGTWARLQSSARVMFKSVTAPDYPNNGGCFRPVKVICPPGTIFTAQRPAPVSTYWEAGAAAIDLLWQALWPIAGERLSAGHFLSICGTNLSGTFDNGELFVLTEPQAGGWGAAPARDGQNGLVAQGNGETRNIPVEVCETRYPLLVEQYALDITAHGAGRWRGGRGMVRDYRLTGPAGHITTTYGRHRIPPWGADGGKPGSSNSAAVIRAGSAQAEVRRGKLARYPLCRGDLVRIITGSGGGRGNPLERPPDALREDLRAGLVTPQQAIEDYGLRFDPETLELLEIMPERREFARQLNLEF
ncbi:MAG: hydantoinase B/oxoprolinase family protein [Anaerolineaceae bacterium]|nr:hydantoinase B/oxoprolinase family protein [Anaerolineaceae bacterium]